MTDELELPYSEEEIAPHAAEERPIPKWQKITAVVMAALLLVSILLWHTRLGADFYPLDASRIMPNLLASFLQWIIVLVGAALLWPPTRRRLHAFADRKLAPIHAHLTNVTAHLKDARADRAELHAKLDRNAALSRHIIKNHPDIPDFPEDDLNA